MAGLQEESRSAAVPFAPPPASRAQLAARFGFTVQRLRNSSGPAYFAEHQHLYLKVSALVLHTQHVAGVNFTRRLRKLSIGSNPAQIARLCSQRASLEESRRPQPLIHPYGVHDPFSYKRYSTCHVNKADTAFASHRSFAALAASPRQCAAGRGRTPVRPEHSDSPAGCRSWPLD